MRKITLFFGIPLVLASLIGLAMFIYDGKITENMTTTTGGCMLFALLIGFALFSTFGKDKSNKNTKQLKVANKKIYLDDSEKIVKVATKTNPERIKKEILTKEKIVQMNIQKIMEN